MPDNKNNLQIYQKYLELIYYTNDLVRKYPKSETFAFSKGNQKYNLFWSKIIDLCY